MDFLDSEGNIYHIWVCCFDPFVEEILKLSVFNETKAL